MRVGIGRLKGDRGFQRLEGAGEVLHHPARDTEMILRIEQTRIQRHGVLESGQRLLGLPFETTHESQAIVSLGHTFVEDERLLVLAGGAGQILAFLEHESEKVVGRGK